MKKPKLAWHQDSLNRWSVTFGQSKLTASIRRITKGPLANNWIVDTVLGKTVHSGEGSYVHRESAMIAAEELAVNYTRKLLNFWVSL